MRLVVITGLSGAGKSLVAKCMEDMGYFCADNLPPALIPKFVEVCSQNKMEKVALVIDIRGGVLLNDLIPALNDIRHNGFTPEILFLDASDNTLVKRFKESRRAHPLAPEGRILNGIAQERHFLVNIRNKADYTIDTSLLTASQLKDEIYKIFARGCESRGMIITLISFGYKYGIPLDCDLIFDVRFIPNPYYISALKKLSGKSDDVKEYVLNCKETGIFIDKVIDMMDFLIPNYIKEGKTQLVTGIGCTGGRHRSVAIADAIQGILAQKQHNVNVDHRDIEKDFRSAIK